jgi:hypothetical protein
MDQEAKQLLEENLKLSKENNELLLKLYKVQRWGQIIRVGYYVVLILIGIGAFYFIKPFLGNLLSVYGVNPSGIENYIK